MGILKIIPGKGIVSHMVQKMVYVLKGFVTYLISCMNLQDRIWSAWISKPEKNFWEDYLNQTPSREIQTSNLFEPIEVSGFFGRMWGSWWHHRSGCNRLDHLHFIVQPARFIINAHIPLIYLEHDTLDCTNHIPHQAKNIGLFYHIEWTLAWHPSFNFNNHMPPETMTIIYHIQI